MAIASKWLAARYNQPGFELFDFNVYVQCSDGDLMEGVAERSRLARRAPEAVEPLLDLRRQQDHDRRRHRPGVQRRRRRRGSAASAGTSSTSTTPTTSTRLPPPIEGFQLNDDGPTLIVVHSIIGYGAPNKADTAEAHGEPLGADEIKLTKAAYGWPERRQVPRAARSAPSTSPPRSASAAATAREAWEELFADVQEEAPGARRRDRAD